MNIFISVELVSCGAEVVVLVEEEEVLVVLVEVGVEVDVEGSDTETWVFVTAPPTCGSNGTMKRGCISRGTLIREVCIVRM